MLGQVVKPADPTTGVRQQGGLMGGMGAPPPGSVQAPADWSRVLEANNAGAAGSAEEFTQQFMSQLTGQTAGNLLPVLAAATPTATPSLQPAQTNGTNGTSWQQQRVASPAMKQVSCDTPCIPSLLLGDLCQRQCDNVTTAA